MIRITTIFLCLILAAAAAGRYQAEESVRKTQRQLDRLELERAEELRAIQMLRAEIAYLENPERLSKIADAKTDLRPSATKQILNAREFATAVGAVDDDGPSSDEPIPPAIIENAIAMAQLGGEDANQE